MSGKARSRIPVWLPMLVVAIALLDVGLTLHGQSSAYWRGNYADATEANPIAKIFVSWHPLAFAGMAAVYLVVILVAMRILAPRMACGLALVVVCGHTIGVAAWLLRLGAIGPWLAIAFLIAVAPMFSPMRRLCEA